MMPGPMNEDIRQLLVLQDRDAKASRLEAELESIDPEREKTGRDSLQAQQLLEQVYQFLKPQDLWLLILVEERLKLQLCH